MEEQKTEIVEKRVSGGVIRRRSRRVAKPEGEAKKPAEKKKLTLEDAAPKKPVKAAEPEKPVVEKKVEAAAPPKKVKAPVEEKPRRRSLTLDDVAKKRAEENLKKNLAGEEPAPEPTPQPEAKALASDEKIVKEKKKTPTSKKDEPRVLSFKDRVKGTIDLSQFKGQERKKETAEQTDDDKSGESRFRRPAVATADKTKEQQRQARVRKGVKTIGGDLDVEGVGRKTNLSQLNRAPVDRVFQPNLVTHGRARKKKILSKKNLKSTVITEKKASKRVISIDQTITVGNLAQELGEKAGAIIKQLMDLGIMATINQEIDRDTATLIAAEHKYEVKDKSFKEEEALKESVVSDEDLANAPSRPPVVTVMGHVDHGKTSLLDAIRSTDVTSGEAGGITQHIGAYTVGLDQGQVTFIDTPGHEAFTTMRARGANVTDIVILVVAADDGLMPQTEESIDHARAAGVPIIVAVNKIDKEEANPDMVTRQLSEKGLLSEEWGGDVIFNKVSALKRQGIKELLESVLLQAEVLELKAPIDKPAQGTVLESKLEKGRGAVATLLVQTGSIKVGDYVVAGECYGKVRAMMDWKGNNQSEAGPSSAVEILGLDGSPEAGDNFNVVDSDQAARKLVDFRKDEKRREASGGGSMSLEDVFAKMKAGEMTELNIVLKADVQGSLEAVKEAIGKIGNEEVKAKIIHSAVGGINESDVSLAKASNAIVIGFSVRPETKALHQAKEAKIEIKLYKVIYDLVNEVKLAMEGLLEPDRKEEYMGRAEVRQTFSASKLGTVAGCMVVDGVITRNSMLRVLRDNVVVFEGNLTSLRRFKDDAKDVKQGFECGIGIEGFKDLKEGDIMEAFQVVEIKKTL